MPTARISRRAYDALVESFRAHPRQPIVAARAAGVSYRTAVRAWERGWDEPRWAKAIQGIVREDQVDARAVIAAGGLDAVRAEARAEERDRLARLDAAKERAREAEGVRSAMSTSMMLLANVGALSTASMQVAQETSRLIMAAVAERKLSIDDGVRLLTRVSALGAEATKQLRDSMGAIRLHLGRPEGIVGVVQGDGPTTAVDAEAAIAELGEEGLRAAIVALANGEMGPEVDALLAWQARAGAGGVH